MSDEKKNFNITFAGVCGAIAGLIGFSISYWFLGLVFDSVESYLKNKLKGE